VAAIFADWQSCSDDFHELTDPIQAQYKEFFIVVGAKYQGKPVSRCVYIWVDKDFAMYRGYIQGFPKKLGAIHMTRTFAVGKAAPKIEAGARFGATCTAGSREVARSVITLQELSKTVLMCLNW
jgi:acetoacetate decarboxylase